MRELTEAEKKFCKENDKTFKGLTPDTVDGINVLLDNDPIVCHARTKLAIIIVPKGTDICKAFRELSLRNYHVIPFTEDEVLENVQEVSTIALLTLFPFMGDIEDFGLYCIDNAEVMEEALRGAW